MDIVRFQRSLDWLMECGISLTKISKEVGKSRNYLSSIRAKGFVPPDSTLEDMRIAFKKRAIILSRFSPDKHKFSELYLKVGFRAGKLADKIGVSRQAINTGNLSENNIRRLTEEINQIGESILKMIS